MRKKFTLSQKLQAGLALAIVFLLVLATNRLDHRHFSTVQNTVNSVYEDRVVAQDYIYKLNNLFHEKRFDLNTDTENAIATGINAKIVGLLDKFGETKLTSKEANHFESLQTHFSDLQQLEKSSLGKEEATIENHSKIDEKLEAILVNMNHLANTQLSESRQLTDIARKSLGVKNLFSNLEIIFVIIIGIVIQIIIFYPNKTN